MTTRSGALAATLCFGLAVTASLHDVPERRADIPRELRPDLALGPADDPKAQAEMEFLMLRDPRTNAVPPDMRARELIFARSLPSRDQLRAAGAALAPLTWEERGPTNVGGRTRVFAADAANPDILIAGAVAGGIWRSTDDGASWALTTGPSQIHTTTCIAQDRRPGRTATWYVGTGEFRGSTNNDTRWGSLYRGDGVFKSTDNGVSWNLLPSTSSGTPNVTDPFDYCWNIATHPARSDSDEVLLATYIGIYRSLDGGGSWTRLFTSDSSFTDVVYDPAGVAYATFKSGGVPRVWRSPDGVAWTDITPDEFPTGAGRIVFGPAPSDSTALYVFVQGTTNEPAQAGHQLWHYRWLSGSGAGTGGAWENRGGNLPSDINTQGGYDMLVHVKPDDPATVLIGGTNLYRSTDGFTSGATIATIGGYPWYWAGDPTHHPDLHGGLFRAGNPSVYYSSHDGGLSKTLNVMSPAVTWTSLNNGYNVTQFYSVSLAPEAGSNVILAGAQDNGTQLGTSPGASAWVMAFGGDGTVVRVAPAVQDRLYIQYQFGGMYRMRRDLTDQIYITPNGSTNHLFVTPIVLDPTAPARLYFPAGRTSPAQVSAIWRNDDAPNATTTAGWTLVPGTDVGSGGSYTRRITALGISTASSPNVLYYGTVDGIVRRVDNAHTASPVVTTITPPGLGGGTVTGGFVRGIAVDPQDSRNALVVFGNYNFQSLWYTTDAGASWTDVEGNLAGPAGPSVRFAAMAHVDGVRHVFLATSIGVLSSTVLDGASTIWVQEGASEMGNIIVGYLDYRPSDRTIAAGTHARGVFTAQIPSTFTTVTAQVRSGWNLVSLPVTTPLDSVTEVFPQAVSAAFRFVPGTGHEASPVLEPGTGYWLKVPAAAAVEISGAPLPGLPVAVSAGWNLIGSVTSAVDLAAVGQSPPGIVVSPFYDFGPTGYAPVSVLHPGGGVWVKVSAPGTLTLPGL
jgi:hypothetical protein